MPLIRLQKFLSNAGICSRRQGEEYILNGRVQVNGKTITTLGTKTDPLKDQVFLDLKPVKIISDKIYMALNKPKGYITSCSQPGQNIVLDLINIKQRVYPVGRLDKDSTGLLLLTNDGRLHHKLSHPSFDHEKEYLVTVKNPISDSAIQRIANGMIIMGTKTRPAKIKRISAKRFSITLKEGRNRQIRRMIRKVGNSVNQLKRIRIANIKLGTLEQGTWRFLTEIEKNNLL